MKPLSVAFQPPQQLPRGRVPHPCRLILVRGDDALPSGDHAALETSPLWPSSFASNCPVAAFQTRAVLSALAVTMCWPSGDHATLQSMLVWPSNFASNRAGKSHRTSGGG